MAAAGGVGAVETPTAALRRLGAAGCTGALEFAAQAPAEPCGWVYLVDGEVAYAEATTVPGVDVRLVRAGLVPAPRWRSLARDLDTGRAGWDDLVDLTRSAAVPDGELERIVRSATADATVALLGDEARARCRFRTGRRRWAGRRGCTAVGDLLDEAAAGLRLLASSPVGPDDPVELRPAGDGGVTLAPPQLAILAALAGDPTPRQAAWRSGLAVLDAVAALSDLAEQGACEVVAHRHRTDVGVATDADATTRRPTRAPAPGPPAPRPARTTPARAPAPTPAMTSATATAPAPTADPPAPAPLPRRRPVPSVRPRPGHEPGVAATDAQVLRRLIEALHRR